MSSACEGPRSWNEYHNYHNHQHNHDDHSVCGQHHKYLNLSDVATSLQAENMEEVVEDTLHHSGPGFHNFFWSFSNIFCLFSVLNYSHSLPGLIKIPQTRCVKNTAMDTYQEILDHWIMCRSSYEAKGRSVLEKIGEFDSPFSLSFSLLLSSLIFTQILSHTFFSFKPLSSLFINIFPSLRLSQWEKSPSTSFAKFCRKQKAKKRKKLPAHVTPASLQYLILSTVACHYGFL